MKKEELYEMLLTLLNDRYAAMLQAWESLLESNQQEGKSTAGDKHETAGAMVHLEMEQQGRQLEETKRHIAEMSRWKPDQQGNGQVVVMGSLVETTCGLFYMITGLGRIEFENTTVYVIGPYSPMGKALMGKGKGQSFDWGQIKGEVIAII
ncbi:MAG: hypothetical protein RLY35_167 [Bacteroidota bacterium]